MNMLKHAWHASHVEALVERHQLQTRRGFIYVLTVVITDNILVVFSP